MSLVRTGCAAVALALLLVVAARAQDSSERPLGDLAREQRDARKLQNLPEKVYTNEDVAPEPAAGSPESENSTVALAASAESDSKPQDSAGRPNPSESNPPNTPQAKGEVQSENPSEVQKKDQSKNQSEGQTQDKPGEPSAETKPAPPAKPSAQNPRPSRPVTDRANEKVPDFLIVPAGTEIKVDISEENPDREPEHVLQGKVVAPVRVGFATAIPALSKTTVQLSLRYYDAGYLQPGYANVARLTAVTVDGTTYDVESSEIPVGPLPALTSEVSFTLLRALAIKR